MEQNCYLNRQKISIRNEIHNEITKKNNAEALTRKTNRGRQVDEKPGGWKYRDYHSFRLTAEQIKPAIGARDRLLIMLRVETLGFPLCWKIPSCQRTNSC